MKAYMWLLCLASILYAGNAHITLSEEEQRYILSHRDIKVCTNPSLMPFEVLTPEGNHEGIGADLLSLVSGRVGLNVKIIQTYTWEDSLEKAKDTQCDIVSLISQTPELDTWLLFSDPILVDKNVLITTDTHSFIGDLKSIPSGTLALPRGSPLFAKIEKEFPHVTLFTVASESDALVLVANKQVDMTIKPFALVAYQIKQQGFFNLKIGGHVEGIDTIFRIGITGNNTILRDILNKGIQSVSLREKETIVNRYIPSIVQQPLRKEVWYFFGTIGLIVSMILLWNYMLRKEVKKAIAQNVENQKLMMQQSKKAELGEMIGNISHQWREPLSSLSGVNLMLIGLMEHDKEIQKEFLYTQLKKVEQTLDFMSQTMQNFLEFYKPSTLLQHFNVYESIEQTLSLIETHLLEGNITVDIQGDETKVLYGIKNEYMQIWLNILNNAIHAFKRSNVDDRRIRVMILDKEVRICDNARGRIDDKELNKGVGLPMCRRILEKYRQKLLFQNTPNGVCIQIVLSNA